MKNFLYKFGLVSLLSFIFSNLLFYFIEKIFHPSLASFITIFIIFNINSFLLFKLKLFKKNKKNYFKLLSISILFRIFEYLLFNFLYLFILTNYKSNYIFMISLFLSYFVKTLFYYKSSINDKNLQILNKK